MHKSLVALVTVCIPLAGLLQLLAIAADGAQSESGTGVTSKTIVVGVTEPDTAAIKAIINIDAGNAQLDYSTLINQVNAQGGINGRKIVAIYEPVDPIGTAPAAAVCTTLTEDDHVFITMGFFQAADTACYVSAHDTPIVGASLTSAAAAAAQAPWYNTSLSDTDLIPKEMSAFDSEGVFTGKKVGVVGSNVDTAEMSQVIPALHNAKADVVQTATNDTPTSDTTAMNAQYNLIAQKFQQAGVDLVVAVGNAGEQFPDALQSNQSTYLPRIIATDQPDFEAYTESASAMPQVYFKNALTAGGIPPANVLWEANGMQKCIAKLRAVPGNEKIGNPLTATAKTQPTWDDPEEACEQVPLLVDLLKAAGKTLNNETLAKGADTLTHLTIPGNGGAFNFSNGHNDGDGPAYIFEWSAAQDKMVLKQTVG